MLDRPDSVTEMRIRQHYDDRQQLSSGCHMAACLPQFTPPVTVFPAHWCSSTDGGEFLKNINSSPFTEETENNCQAHRD